MLPSNIQLTIQNQYKQFLYLTMWKDMLASVRKKKILHKWFFTQVTYCLIIKISLDHNLI